MRILFLTDNFPPEHNAPANRTYEHCKEWVKHGHEVTVVTCFPNFPKGEVFPGYKNQWRQTEWMDGIKVIRVWSFISANKGKFKRTIDFLSFALTSFIQGLWVKCDAVVATSPQFFTAVSGCAIGLLKQRKWIMEVRDLWPESIRAVEAVNSNWVIRLLERIELFLYRNADKVVVVTDSFKENICARGIQRERVYVIKNGVDLSVYEPQPKNYNLIHHFNLSGKFILGYIGTHGLAHGLDFIVRSIHRLNNNSFHFIFIGDGAEKSNVVRLAKELKVENVTFIDSVSKSVIPAYLAAIDVSLVPLRKSTTFESVIPSKIFESVAMNVPILLGVDGETRSIIEKYKAGVYFEPENETDFIEKLIFIRKAVQTGNPFQTGCQKMANDFNRKNLAAQMLQLLIQE